MSYLNPVFLHTIIRLELGHIKLCVLECRGQWQIILYTNTHMTLGPITLTKVPRLSSGWSEDIAMLSSASE